MEVEVGVDRVKLVVQVIGEDWRMKLIGSVVVVVVVACNKFIGSRFIIMSLLYDLTRNEFSQFLFSL